VPQAAPTAQARQSGTLDARTEAALPPYWKQLDQLVTIPGIARVFASDAASAPLAGCAHGAAHTKGPLFHSYHGTLQARLELGRGLGAGHR